MIFIKLEKKDLFYQIKYILCLMTRGVPGTHDIKIMLDFFRKSKSRNFKSIKITKF